MTEEIETNEEIGPVYNGKYRPEHDEQVYKYCLLGAIDKELCLLFEVAEGTLNVWKHKYPSFKYAMDAGKMTADAKVAEKLFNRAIGFTAKETKIATHKGVITDREEMNKEYPPDVKAGICWLNNRRRTNWKNTQDLNHGGHDGGPIETVSLDPELYAETRKQMLEEDDC